MVWNGFCTLREQMVIFCWLRFSQLRSIGVGTVKKLIFPKKNLKNLKSSNGLNWLCSEKKWFSENGLKWILHYERALKSGFFCWLRFSQLWSIGVETVKKLTFLYKKTWKTFEIIKWSGKKFKKLNLKFVRSTPKFYAKYVRMVLKALNLCKIYAKFNAKYVTSTLKINAKYVRSTPNFNTKYARLALNALNLCKIYAEFNTKNVISTLKFNAKYVRSTPNISAKSCKIGVECVEFM